MQNFYDRYIDAVEPLPYETAFGVWDCGCEDTNEPSSTGIVMQRTGAALRLGALLDRAGPRLARGFSRAIFSLRSVGRL